MPVRTIPSRLSAIMKSDLYNRPLWESFQEQFSLPRVARHPPRTVNQSSEQRRSRRTQRPTATVGGGRGSEQRSSGFLVLPSRFPCRGEGVVRNAEGNEGRNFQ